MRTVNFGNAVVYPIVSQQGYDPLIDLFQDYADALDRFIEVWVRFAWDAADWGELVLIEARTPVNHIIPYDDPTPLGKPLKVYLVDPRINDGPFDIPPSMEAEGVHVGYDHGTQVWIKFMPRPNVYTLKPYLITWAYFTGDTVFDQFSGNCYKSLQDNNTGHNLTDPAWWTIVPFPYVLSTIVMRGAYSMALRDEGQHGKAQAEEQAALAALALAVKANLATRYDILTDQQTGVPRSLTAPVQGPS
jgi:hypothetical protein